MKTISEEGGQGGAEPERAEIGEWGSVELAAGRVALLSSVDVPRFDKNRWQLGTNGYVYRAGARRRGTPCLLHRLVMDAEPGQEIHHINGIKTDCRRENLEVTTASEHQRHHRHLLIARNRAARRYSINATCIECGGSFTKDANHRGRQKCCSRRCAIARWRRAGRRGRKVIHVA